MLVYANVYEFLLLYVLVLFLEKFDNKNNCSKFYVPRICYSKIKITRYIDKVTRYFRKTIFWRDIFRFFKNGGTSILSFFQNGAWSKIWILRQGTSLGINILKNWNYRNNYHRGLLIATGLQRPMVVI